MSTAKALKRIINRDIKEISNQKLNSHGIFVHFNEDNMLEAKAMIIGPKDSLYEGSFLFFNITFPNNYPFAPPDIAYISRNRIRIHPNLYVGHHASGHGKVCLSILGTWSGPKWTTVMDITTVLLTIQSLLDSNPLFHEPGHENKFNDQNKMYNTTIQYESINTLLIKNFIQPPLGFDIFHSDMKSEITKNKEVIKKRLECLEKEFADPLSIIIQIYRINLILNYKELNKKYTSLIYDDVK
uniref:Ubiquitin-conjugating enzyme E2 Z n=1 Tax=viral metagenome TaxID=1070528 RepID=A0A6C0F9E3_9ZZZZ|tara:strand:- start:87 stop:809 length:723 start_codon:yes stop_codon:yes gene_type:complete